MSNPKCVKWINPETGGWQIGKVIAVQIAKQLALVRERLTGEHVWMPCGQVTDYYGVNQPNQEAAQ